MNIELSQRVMEDLTRTVRSAFTSKGIVNVSAIAEEIRRRNESENIALEDIAAQVLAQAQLLSAAMEFETPRLN